MFAKSGFVLRSLFVASFLGSLVACTFEDGGPEKLGENSQHQTSRERGADQDSTGADASASSDGGASGHDSGVSHDGGPSGSDGGASTHDGGSTHHDGGAWGQDGGTVSVDAGAWGDDDDADGGGGF